jgi:hypothetical protein
VGTDLELGSLADPFDCPLQLRIGERHQAPATDADHVMVMAARVVALKGDNLAADIDPVNQFELLQLLEGAVDAGAADVRQPAVNLQRRDRAALATKQLDHLQPRRPRPEAGLVEPRPSSIRPSHTTHPT